MEVYKSIYEAMLSKAISYGYVKQQVLDILSESHDRVELSTYKNIPDGERYWMAERWTWETLFADELDAFPGEKPKWKGAAKYLKHMSPAAEETPKKTQEKAGDPSTSNSKELIPTSRVDKAPDATTTTSVPKRTARRLDTCRKSEGEAEDAPVHLAQVMSSKSDRKSNSRTKALKVPAPDSDPTSQTSGTNKRKRTETQLRFSEGMESLARAFMFGVDGDLL